MKTKLTSTTGSNRFCNYNLQSEDPHVFPAILDTLEEPLFLFDSNFKMVWHNRASNEMYQSVSGKPIDCSFDFNELLTEEQQPLFYEHLTKVLAGEKAHFEWRYKKAVVRWLSVSLYPFKTNDGKFAGVCGHMRDITDKKINELTLLRNTAILNNINDAVIYTDLEQQIIYFNHTAEKIYGLASHEVMGCRLPDVIGFEYLNDTKENAAHCISVKENWEGKVVHTRKDGKKVFLLAGVTSLRDKHEHKIGLIATYKDITEEELSKQQSQQHQDNINSIISNIKEGILLIDHNFTILTFNERAYNLEKKICTNLKVGENLLSLLPDCRKKPVIEYLELTLKNKPVEYEVLYPDNTWLLIYFVPVKNKNGDIRQICITYRDITERKLADDLVKTNEKKYRTLVNSLAEGVILQTRDNKILTTNNSAAQILGVTIDELKQNGLFCTGCIIIDEMQEEVPKESLFLKKSGKINQFKNKVIGLQRQNNIQWLRINSASVNNSQTDEGDAIVISFKDITEEKRISGEMEVLSMVAKETNNSVIIFDRTNDRNTLWINEGFTRLTGYAKEDIIGKNVVKVMTGPETDKAMVQYMHRQVMNNESYVGEILIYAKDGSKRLHQVIGQPIKDHNGKVTKYFAMGTDITEQRRMEEERLQKEVEQQKEITRIILQTQELERNELGRELHDNINQILGAVKMQLSFCIEADRKTAKQVTQSSIDHLREAMNEIRNLSHRMVMPRFSESSLEDELNELIQKYNNTKSIQLETWKWREDKIPYTIKETFFRVVQEQLSNIYKHAKADEIIIRLENCERYAVLCVKDNGVGFDTKKKRKGIGITNIVSRVELMNGISSFVSAPGKGCTLSINIPLMGN